MQWVKTRGSGPGGRPGRQEDRHKVVCFFESQIWYIQSKLEINTKNDSAWSAFFGHRLTHGSQDTLHHIHGANEPHRSGCIRMRNQDVSDFFNRETPGAVVQTRPSRAGQV